MFLRLWRTFFNGLGRTGHCWLAVNVALMLSSSFLVSQTPLAFQTFISQAKVDLGSWTSKESLLICALLYFSSSFLRDLQLYTFSFVERSIAMNIGSELFQSSMMNSSGNAANFNSFLMSFQSFFSLLFFTVIPVAMDILFIVLSFNLALSQNVTFAFVAFLIGYSLFSIGSTTYVAGFQKSFFALQARAFKQLTSLFSVSELLLRYKAFGFIRNSYQKAFSENQRLRLSIGLKRSLQANIINAWTASFFILIFVLAISDIQSSNKPIEILIPIEAFFVQSLRRLEIFVRSFRETVNSYVNLANFSEWIGVRNLDQPAPSLTQSSTAQPFPIFPGLTVVRGATGTGKSTLLKALFDSRGLIDRCVLVKQREEFFEASIRDNLLMGRQASDAKVIDLINQLNLQAAVARLPHGLDTQIDPTNPLLSGGELQRLSLVRAWIEDADLVLLDEVTSAQDGCNETAIFSVLSEWSRTTPIILVSHSPTALSYASNVINCSAQGRYTVSNGHKVRDHMPIKQELQLIPPSPWFEKDPSKFDAQRLYGNRVLAGAEWEALKKDGFVHLHRPLGCPNGLPPTPKCPEAHQQNPEVLKFATFLRCLSKELGHPFTNPGMKQENYLVQQIFPVKGREHSDSAASSTKALELHSEHALFRQTPDFLVIGCLKNPDRASTWIARLDINLLSLKTIRALEKAYGSAELESWKQPLLTLNGLVLEKLALEKRNLERLRYDPIYMTFPDSDEAEAFRELRTLLDQSRKAVALAPGDVLILDNRSCVHGRESFEAKFDDHDRWMMRTMVKVNRSPEPARRTQ